MLAPTPNIKIPDPPTQEELDEFLAQLARHKEETIRLLTSANAIKRNAFIKELDILRYAAACELPMFMAFAVRTTMAKSYVMSYLKQPLYETRTYSVPFALVSPKGFFTTCSVAKTRLLADATGQSRITLYNAARDKVWRTFIPNEAAEYPNILATIGIPYWSFSVMRTQVGEGRSVGMYVPEDPTAGTTSNLVDVPDDLDINPKRHVLGAKPCKRVKIIQTGDLEDV